LETNTQILELIKGCKKQQPQWQRALVDQFSGLLFVICNRYIKDKEYAKDALQETLVKIFQNLQKFDSSKGTFNTWISTIAIRTCLTKMRKGKLTVVQFEDVIPDDMSYNIESDILDGYDAELFIQFINELPDGYRAVFNLAAIDGYSHKEIAELLEIKVSTSRARLNRAKNILKKKVNALKNKELWVNTI